MTNILIKFNVNNLEYKTVKDSVLIEALARNNIEIPRFCFHENLSIAGNCRMCLVEIKNSIKPVASCAINVTENMTVFTNTKLVKQAREYVLEFLLINHPLDCPICDQGGECDLQDQSYVFGGDRGRFYESKRAVSNKFSSPIIKMILTRCIHCTRCVRFFEEVAGTPFFGMINRGNAMQISTYTKNNIVNFELSGNVIDLCPVGALTLKPTEFKGRAWELEQAFTIDFFDTYNSNIRIDFKNNYEIVKILPDVNINNHFISDKTRLFIDVLNYKNKYSEPYYYNSYIYVKISWDMALKYIVSHLLKSKIKVYSLGNFLDLNTLLHFKNILHFTKGFVKFEKQLNIENYINLSSDTKFLFCNIINFINLKQLQNLLLINCNLRYEMPVLNYKIRNYSLNNSILIGILGNIKNIKFNYKYVHLGITHLSFCKIIQGKSWFCNNLVNYYYNLNGNQNLKVNQILFGIFNIFNASTAKSIQYLENFISTKIAIWNPNCYTFINILQSNLTLINAFYLNIFSNKIIDINLIKNYKKNLVYYSINEDIITLKETYQKSTLFTQPFQSTQKLNKFQLINIEPENSSFLSPNYFSWKKNLKIYQGIYPELFFDQWNKNNYDVILPVKNLFEYNSKTISFDGKINSFLKIFSMPHLKTHSDVFMSLLKLYLPFKFKIRSIPWIASRSEKSLKKLKIYQGIVYNDTNNKNVLFNFYDNLIKQNTKYNIFNNLITRNYSNSFVYENTNSFFKNNFNQYYNSDYLSKISEHLNICSNFFKKEDNF